MSNKDFAGLLGVSENSVSSWTTGQYQPRHTRIEQIAAALGVTVDHLHGAAPPAPAAPPPPSAASPPTTMDDAAEQIVRGLARLDLENTLATLQRVTPPLMDIFSAAQRYVDEH